MSWKLPDVLRKMVQTSAVRLEQLTEPDTAAPTSSTTTTTNTSSGIPYGTLTTSNSGLSANYPGIAYNNPVPDYTTWTTATGISLSDTADFKKIRCKLPEGALEKLMTIGLIKSKKVLKQRIQEAFTNWCNTGEMEVSVFPMLLAACVLIMNDENETTLKEEK
jgi:hypothetical protein